MSPPQSFTAACHSSLPLQRSFRDFPFEIGYPLALCVEHRDLVLELDKGEPPQTMRVQLRQDPAELVVLGLERRRPVSQMPSCLVCGEVVHEHQAGREVLVLAPRL